MIYPRPEWPCGHHTALMFAMAPATLIDDVILRLDDVVRDPLTDNEMRQVMTAVLLDAMRARYDRDDAELADILDEAP